MSTAILTQAFQVSIQQMDVNNNLIGPAVLLQTQSYKPKKHLAKIDLTNSASPPRRAEFAPGNQQGSVSINGICDATGFWDLLWTTISDTANAYAWVTWFLVKPNGANVPLTYACKVLFEDVELDWTTSAEGRVGMFSASGVTIGSFVKNGADISAAVVTGAIN
jgi:hypothetical protein